MSYQVLELDSAERARQKQARRDRDSARLQSGKVSPAELQRENSFFGPLNPSKFEIVAIGGRPISALR
jgi:hypothetical protein